MPTLETREILSKFYSEFQDTTEISDISSSEDKDDDDILDIDEEAWSKGL